MSGAFDYAGLRDGTVNLMLAKFGKELKLYRKTDGAYDPTTGISVVQEQVLTYVGATMNYNARQVDGSRILSSDRRVLISPSNQTKAPQVGDDFYINTERFRIVNVEATQPADVVVLWECQARKV